MNTYCQLNGFKIAMDAFTHSLNVPNDFDTNTNRFSNNKHSNTVITLSIPNDVNNLPNDTFFCWKLKMFKINKILLFLLNLEFGNNFVLGVQKLTNHSKRKVIT